MKRIYEIQDHRGRIHVLEAWTFFWLGKYVYFLQGLRVVGMYATPIYVMVVPPAAIQAPPADVGRPA